MSASTGPVAAPEWNAYVEDFRRAGHEVVDWIAHYLEHTRDYPVLPKVKPGDLTDALPPSAPESGETYAAILRDFDDIIVPAVTHWNHPRFMAYFATSASAPAILAEALSAALNTNGLHWKTSPAVAELEQVALGWLRQWLGLPDDYFGMIYDTASVSSLHALAAAREMADPEARVEGSRPLLTLYTSAESHSSIEKAAIALGVGQKNVRKIPVDAEFRMRPGALAQSIEADVQQRKHPFCVV
ncbi:MAG: pyridoxal phosphate-dependent decarboxylase family protein, partial [Terriglobales bacterium]